MAFCQWLSGRTGLEVSLPTEALANAREVLLQLGAVLARPGREDPGQVRVGPTTTTVRPTTVVPGEWRIASDSAWNGCWLHRR